MSITTKKAKTKGEVKEDFSMDEEDSSELITIYEGEPKIEGTILKSFTFESDDDSIKACDTINPESESIKQPEKPATAANTILPSSNLKSSETSNSYDIEEIQDNRTLKLNPNGRTPPVDGEVFDMVRSYTLRRSTVRILSKIKAIHMDDNVYLNTIVDEAIRYYYDHLKNNL